MEETSAEPEAHHGTLTHEEQIHCHKARIFSVLNKAPVVRGWIDAICDGAVYLGKDPLPISYADRYFQINSTDISYVTFSIVTAFKDTTELDDDGKAIELSQCYISLAQREASEFLIVTFSDDHNTVAILPHRLYWPVKGEESNGQQEVDPGLEISASSLSKYSISITLLIANIDEIKRITVNPMHPTTTPFQIGLDGKIPRAGVPMAIVPDRSEPQTEQSLTEGALRSIHRKFAIQSASMRVDFLEYQPLLRDFKIVFTGCEEFPNGLEAVISHNFGSSDESGDDSNSHHLRYADYILTHGFIPQSSPAFVFFVPRKLIPEYWFTAPRPRQHMPRQLYDSGMEMTNKNFLFEEDDAGAWIQKIQDIISKYPPGEHPTRAEKKREIWKKAFPWPELEAQIASQKDSTPLEALGDCEQPSSEHGSRAGDEGAVKSSDISLLADHYLAKASLDEDGGREDAA